MVPKGICPVMLDGLRFSPISLFLRGEQGAWYDPSDLTTLFQDSAGTTPVTAVEQPVGLMKDKSGRGNHAFQATAGNRPTLSARVNLLTKTEDFSDAAWAYLVNSTKVDYQTISFAGAGRFGMFGMSGITLGSSYTYSIEVKAGTKAGTIRLVDSDNPSPFVEVTLNSTWQKLTFQYSPVNFVYFSLQNSDGNAGTVLVRNADLRPTNAGALLPPYQRVNTASDYDTVGFPLYLKCNGTSSAMSTNSIDFTSTDKMTVVTGVRKLSDASGGVLMELSGDYNTNAGTFGYVVPRSPTLTEPVYATKGTSLIVLANSSNVAPSPINWVLSGQSSISTPIASSRINGATYASSSASQGSGNFGNYPLYLFARVGTVVWFNGQFYGAIIRGAQSDTASVTQTENYMATKTGITF